MHIDNVFDIRSHGRKNQAIECKVEIRFYEGKIGYSISGIEMELSDRLALAAALEATANDLRGLAKGIDLFRRD